MKKVLDVWLRTGAAARILEIPRASLVRMLESGKYDITWRREDGGYREVYYPDLLAYKKQAEKERKAAYAAYED